VAAVYIYTQTVYTEYRGRNTHNKYKKKKKTITRKKITITRKKLGSKLGSAGRAFAFQLRKKHGKLSVRVVEKCPDIPVAVVQYTFTHKRYTEQKKTFRKSNKNY
jgi:hypothetical protein